VSDLAEKLSTGRCREYQKRPSPGGAVDEHSIALKTRSLETGVAKVLNTFCAGNSK
jgi:hypothetical protein